MSWRHRRLRPHPAVSPTVSEGAEARLTQQLVQQVQDVLPGRARLGPRALPEVGRAVVHVEAVDAVGHQRQHALMNRGRQETPPRR